MVRRIDNMSTYLETFFQIARNFAVFRVGEVEIL